MAEYSQEYNQTQGIEDTGDFSIKEIFNELKLNSSYTTICEGFGIITIMDKDSECYIKFEDGREKYFKEIIVLTELGLNKEDTNQSTYFGAHRTVADFARDLHNAVSKMEWKNADIVTIYYPKVATVNGKNIADIGRHPFKSEGNKILNHTIFKG